MGNHILLPSEVAQLPSGTRLCVLAPAEVGAPLEEGIVEVKAIHPSRGTGLENHKPRGGRRYIKRRSQSPDTRRVSSGFR